MTFYFLSHYLQIGLLPPGINFLFIFSGWLFAFYWQVFGRFLMMIGVISFYLFSIPIVAYSMINGLQNQYPVLEKAALNKPSASAAIVVLGGGSTIAVEYGDQKTVSAVSGERLHYAAYLYQKWNIPIIVSGGKLNPEDPSEADLMDQILRHQYHITSALKEDKSLTTADESQFVADILKQHQFKTIYLVTNAWHMPRSMFIFQRAGIKAIPAPMGYFVYGPGYSWLSFLPNMEALYASSVALHEWIGIAWYHLRFITTRT